MYIITFCSSSVENPIMDDTKDLECSPHVWDLQRRGSKALLTLEKCRGRACMLWFPWRPHSFLPKILSFATHSAQSLQSGLCHGHTAWLSVDLWSSLGTHTGRKEKKHFQKNSHVPFILWVLNTQLFFFSIYTDFLQSLKEPRSISNCSQLVGDF